MFELKLVYYGLFEIHNALQLWSQTQLPIPVLFTCALVLLPSKNIWYAAPDE